MSAWKQERNTRGAVFVEHLIAYLPVIFFFLATWQLIELCAAQLVVKRAASAAARAAVVVLPDDPMFYDDETKDQTTPLRSADIRLAASLITATNPHLRANTCDPVVTVAEASGAQPGTFEKTKLLTATVQADFGCFAGWASVVCGFSGVRRLTARSTYAYQGASYKYEL